MNNLKSYSLAVPKLIGRIFSLKDLKVKFKGEDSRIQVDFPTQKFIQKLRN